MHRDSHSAARGLAAEAVARAGSAPAPGAAQPCLFTLGEASGQFPNLLLPLHVHWYKEDDGDISTL